MLSCNSFSVRIADKVIKVYPVCPQTKDYCADYLCEEKEDFAISIHPEDIEYERKKSAQADLKENKEIRGFSDRYLETLALYRKIAEKMLEYDTFLFHGSCIAVDGVGYLFTAASGTGKSTHTRLWREYFGDRATMVNDDKPLIYVGENEIRIHGTPWNGKHHLGENISVPLKAICFLKRGAENRIARIDKSLAYPMLLQQAYRPQNTEKLTILLSLLDRLGDKVSLYQMHCNMDQKAVQVAYQGMKN
ncbi:MAG: hypothetical protein IJY27_03545 [Clostridia bacterium]|nr:hypothetical protein [Clostridia bacterium]